VEIDVVLVAAILYVGSFVEFFEDHRSLVCVAVGGRQYMPDFRAALLFRRRPKDFSRPAACISTYSSITKRPEPAP
jgi:hypothetical protein